MKSLNRIVFLTLAVVAIVMFWLVPGINQATTLEYTRLYEDTDYRDVILKDTTKKEKAPKPPKGYGGPEEKHEEKAVKEDKAAKAGKVIKEEKTMEAAPSAKARPAKKFYRRQPIRPKDKKFKLEAKMFSRAVQFVEEAELDSSKSVVVEDSLKTTPNL